MRDAKRYFSSYGRVTLALFYSCEKLTRTPSKKLLWEKPTALQSKRILEFLPVQKIASSDSKGVIMDPDCLNSARFSRA